MIKDTSETKEKIISVMRRNGPSLPVQIARESETSVLFTSAFLSELAAEKKIKISDMKVGNSPLYFIQGHEHLLEKFSNYLKSREKDAFTILKEKRFLKDSEQEPAIRIALREIRDFAIAFKKEDEIFWRYFSVPEEEFQVKEKPEPKVERKVTEEKLLNIFEKPKKERKEKKTVKEKENKLFIKLKEFLSEKKIELKDIRSFSKNEIIIQVVNNGEEKIIIAYNKRKINENDLIKAGKKASEFNLPYTILSLGEPLKKIQGIIDAVKNLSSIEKLK